MTKTENLPAWAGENWLETATAWVDAQLARRGRERVGPVEQTHVRPWSCVLRVPTAAGETFFKATAPALAHETALTMAVSDWKPQVTLSPLGADTTRGWMLMPDGGTRLRAVLTAGPTPDIAHWLRLLPLYAELQIATIPHADEMLTLGTMDRRLSVLPAQYEGLLAETDALRIGHEDGLTEEEYVRLRALPLRLTDLCHRLAQFGIPETLQHDDLHDGNIFLREDGRYLFFDWGDACVSHPFLSLLVVLRSVAARFGWPDDAFELEPLRDAYLEPWSDFGSREDLREAARLAYNLGMVCRALTWHRILAGVEAEQREPYAEAVPGWLQEFLTAMTAEEST